MTNRSKRHHEFNLTTLLEQPLDLLNHLPFKVATLSNLMMLDRDSSIRQFTDLGPREIRVLINIGSYQPIKAADIAYQSRMDSYTVSRSVKVLVKQGLIFFTSCEHNKRIKELELTDQGVELYQKIAQYIESRSEKLSSVISKKEQALLFDVLERLEDKMESILAENAKELQQKGEELPAMDKELLRWHKRLSE